MKFKDWVEQWKEQYAEHIDDDVLHADIQMKFRNNDGEIHICKSAYQAKDMPKIQIVESKQPVIYPKCS